jgi:hypothetical protein
MKQQRFTTILSLLHSEIGSDSSNLRRPDEIPHAINHKRFSCFSILQARQEIVQIQQRNVSPDHTLHFLSSKQQKKFFLFTATTRGFGIGAVARTFEEIIFQKKKKQTKTRGKKKTKKKTHIARRRKWKKRRRLQVFKQWHRDGDSQSTNEQ